MLTKDEQKRNNKQPFHTLMLGGCTNIIYCYTKSCHVDVAAWQINVNVDSEVKYFYHVHTFFFFLKIYVALGQHHDVTSSFSTGLDCKRLYV